MYVFVHLFRNTTILRALVNVCGGALSGASMRMPQDRKVRTGNSNTGKPIALVTEDEWLLREEIVRELEQANWTVLEASTAEGAIALLRTGQHVDLVITDIQLAGVMNGWDVAVAFRATYPKLPVVYVSEMSPDLSRSVPGSLFFAKPYHAARIVEAAQSLLGH